METLVYNLLEKYLTASINESEKAELASLLRQPSGKELLQHFIDERLNEKSLEGEVNTHLMDESFNSLIHLINLVQSEEKPSSTVHRIHFLKTAWFRYAAAVVICLGIGAYLWINKRNGKELATTNSYKQLQMDVPPGGEKAILTLSDGTKIVLDNAANGNLAQQGSTEVVKLANGQIVYKVKGVSGKEVMWNTMATPTGGQYQIILPDGTKVWLNASSSIMYPTAFITNKREVKIKGEVYFEVAKNKQKPFIVDINGESLVEVLGTSFNVNSYENEASIKTTLLEGSVRVLKTNTTAVDTSSDRQPISSRTDDKLKGTVILKPGEQAIVASSGQQPKDVKGVTVVSGIDVDQALAWKNGWFNFNGLDLKAVMRQLERWYDIKVQYQGSVDNGILRGKIYRSVNLSDVLDILQKVGEVKFKLEGKNLIVL